MLETFPSEDGTLNGEILLNALTDKLKEGYNDFAITWNRLLLPSKWSLVRFTSLRSYPLSSLLFSTLPLDRIHNISPHETNAVRAARFPCVR